MVQKLLRLNFDKKNAGTIEVLDFFSFHPAGVSLFLFPSCGADTFNASDHDYGDITGRIVLQRGHQKF